LSRRRRGTNEQETSLSSDSIKMTRKEGVKSEKRFQYEETRSELNDDETAAVAEEK
jgi:hypothetical protein